MADETRDLTDLIDLISHSKVRGLALTIEVTPTGFSSTLRDHKGQRGSSVSGVYRRGADAEFDTLNGQARFLLKQEAAIALKASDHE